MHGVLRMPPLILKAAEVTSSNWSGTGFSASHIGSVPSGVIWPL